MDNPTGLEDLGQFFDLVFNFLYAWTGPIAVIFFILAGFRYVMAGGDKKKAQEARDSIKHVIIGVIIILTSYLVVVEVFKQLGYVESSGIAWIDEFYGNI